MNSLQLNTKIILNIPDNSMHQGIVQLTEHQSTNLSSDRPMGMKLQLFQRLHQYQASPPLKELESIEKNQTSNEQSQSEESQSDCNSSDVSFEDDILESHETALNFQIGRNQGLFILQDSQAKTLKTIVKIGSFFDNLPKILKTLPNTSFQAIETFCMFIKNNKIFKRFLEYLHYCYNYRVSNKLLQLSFLIWFLYRTFLTMELNKPEIFMIINDVSKILYVNQSVFGRCSTQLLTAQKNKMKEVFIHFFVSTVVFVLEGFFKNPLCSPPIVNRKCSKNFSQKIAHQQSQLEELEPCCRKMVKTELS